MSKKNFTSNVNHRPFSTQDEKSRRKLSINKCLSRVSKAIPGELGADV